MKTTWLAVGALAVGGVAIAAAWRLGSGDASPTAAKEAAAPAPAARGASVAAAPLGAVAIVLAHAKPAPLQAPSRRPSDDASSCGTSGQPCPEDAVCLDGGCVSTTCAADGGGGSCALAEGRIGSCCGARCADLLADGANCGSCGSRCESGLDCVSGACLARSCTGRMAGTACGDESGGAGGRCCRGACVDPSRWSDDTSNCGACGHACAPGLTCQQAVCADPSTGGPPSWTCVDPGHGCPAGTFCAVDACLPLGCSADSDGQLCPSPTPGVPGHCCGGRCTDLFADRDNCRACGLRCAPGQSCRGGECEAPEP